MTTGRINQVASRAHKRCELPDEYRQPKRRYQTALRRILARCCYLRSSSLYIEYDRPLCNRIAQRIAHHKLSVSPRLHRTVPLQRLDTDKHFCIQHLCVSQVSPIQFIVSTVSQTSKTRLSYMCRQFAQYGVRFTLRLSPFQLLVFTARPSLCLVILNGALPMWDSDCLHLEKAIIAYKCISMHFTIQHFSTSHTSYIYFFDDSKQTVSALRNFFTKNSSHVWGRNGQIYQKTNTPA